ncbi:MAG TPA: NifB/NifX family molybdenum-iron cluster-binding protein [Candidatus Krumholzibacteria bacterium]|nr:NifB/NifX family molybdenum-iron cluster-binding protein [Candidatus Krumholzibacteria bacterium]HPD70843.1 NifB/NifX family molybdenum-iron cluster-binding protein [Candidatus Krumholzibacteria bacterium]HRY39457.1 NifB/NifX family molybdenum-iron cluster-binding protein [Candidatus Krumholzibacteria bacterium]
MKVCMPTMGGAGTAERLAGHFGSAAYFTICDTASGEVRTVANGDHDHAHGMCQPLQALAGEAIDAVLTGGMGRRAVQLMNERGIRVFQLAGHTVAEALAALEAGELPELTPDTACGGHGRGHGCGH